MAARITIVRTYSSDAGTFGVMHHDGVPFAVTAERPWKNNAVSASCIPEGVYVCRRKQSSKYGEVFEVLNVPGRTDILLHKGNNPLLDSEGCILVAKRFGYLHGKLAVLSSKAGYEEFTENTKGQDSFLLQIVKVSF